MPAVAGSETVKTKGYFLRCDLLGIPPDHLWAVPSDVRPLSDYRNHGALERRGESPATAHIHASSKDMSSCYDMIGPLVRRALQTFLYPDDDIVCA